MAKHLVLMLLILAPAYAMAQVHNHRVSAPAYHTTHKAPTPEPGPANPKYRHEPKIEQKVYICSEGKALAYHATNNCSGLKSCGAKVSAIAKPAGKENKMAACIRCYATAR